MRTNAVFHQCAKTVNSLVREHWRAREAYLDEMIGAEKSDETRLNLQVDCEPEVNRFAVRAVLLLPSATLTAEALDVDVVMALDRVADLLAQMVRGQLGETSPLAEEIDEVEDASAASFPASDAPAWTRVSS